MLGNRACKPSSFYLRKTFLDSSFSNVQRATLKARMRKSNESGKHSNQNTGFTYMKGESPRGRREAKSGDRVAIHYTAKLDDHVVIDSTSGKNPLEIRAGGSDIIRGLSLGVIGMKIGETKVTYVDPRDAFGEFRSDLITSLPRNSFSQEVNEGDVLADSDDPLQTWRVTEVNDREVIVDGNHPMAGKGLHLEIALVAIK